MTGTEHRFTGRARTAALAAVLAAAGLFAGAPAAASASAEPPEGKGEGEGAALSIEVTDGINGIAPGDTAEYEVALRNDGEEELTGVLISQGVPAQLEIVGTDGERVDGAAASGGLVVWEKDIAPGAVVTGGITARLAGDPGTAWRVVTTACAQTDRSAPPVVCATDADLLPEPADAGSATAGGTGSGVGLPTPTEAAVAAGGAGLLLAAVALLVFWRRRERRRFDAGW